MAKTVTEASLLLARDTFKCLLLEQLGPIQDKSPFEREAWSLALIELALELLLHQSSGEDNQSGLQINQNV